MVTNGHVIHIMGQALKPLVSLLPKRSAQVKTRLQQLTWLCVEKRRWGRGTLKPKPERPTVWPGELL